VRILLDSRDLIALVDHQRPVTPPEFDAYLRGGNHQIVLCNTNVRELCGALSGGADFRRVQPFLQSLAAMPHLYLKEATIVAVEIQAAVAAFTTGTEYQNPSPYVTRWDGTLVTPPGERGLAAENLLNLRLDDIIDLISRTRPDVFAPPAHHLGTLREIAAKDRALLRVRKAPSRENFTSSVKKHAATHGVRLPEGREQELAEWIYADANRCPGLRLFQESFRALMVNYEDAPETSDIFDLAQISAIPHVDAATLDRRMRRYCGDASRKMLECGARDNYRDRVYENISDIMARHPGPV
jgi:hypothetical protein